MATLVCWCYCLWFDDKWMLLLLKYNPVQKFAMLVLISCWMILPEPIPCWLCADRILFGCWKYWNHAVTALLQIWNMLYAVVWLHCEHYQLPCQLCIVGISIAMTSMLITWTMLVKPCCCDCLLKSYVMMLMISCCCFPKPSLSRIFS